VLKLIKQIKNNSFHIRTGRNHASERILVHFVANMWAYFAVVAFCVVLSVECTVYHKTSKTHVMLMVVTRLSLIKSYLLNRSFYFKSWIHQVIRCAISLWYSSRLRPNCKVIHSSFYPPLLLAQLFPFIIRSSLPCWWNSMYFIILNCWFI